MFIGAFRDEAAESAMLAFLERALPVTVLSAVVMQELAAGARTAAHVRKLEQAIFNPFERRQRVFTPSAEAFAASGRLIAQLATREGWSRLHEKPSLLNDALIATSCRERGITLITNDRDYDRFRPLLKRWTTAAPWPRLGTRAVSTQSPCRSH
ncbi:MAG: type II toxin-antitoxin system VapC family toxin [Burkholderiaceae bacterium]